MTCPCYFVQRSDGRQTDVDENSYVAKRIDSWSNSSSALSDRYAFPGMYSRPALGNSILSVLLFYFFLYPRISILCILGAQREKRKRTSA